MGSQHSYASFLFTLKYCPECHGDLFLPNPEARLYTSDEFRQLFKPCPHCLESVDRFLASRMRRYEEGTQKAGGSEG